MGSYFDLELNIANQSVVRTSNSQKLVVMLSTPKGVRSLWLGLYSRKLLTNVRNRQCASCSIPMANVQLDEYSETKVATQKILA